MLSLMLSSAVGTMNSYFQNMFPEGYFKRTYVDTATVSAALSKLDRQMKGSTRIQLPALGVGIEYNPGDDTVFGAPHQQWFNRGNFHERDPRGRLHTVFYDDDRGFYIYIIPDRFRLNLQFYVAVKGRLQAYNVIAHLKRAFNIEMFSFLNGVYLEAPIPETIIQVMMEDLKLDTTKQSVLNDFAKYLDRHSAGQISRKTNLSTGRKHFSYRYSTNILFRVSSQPNLEFREEGDSEGYSVVSLPMELELWVPGRYLLQYDDKRVISSPINEVDGVIDEDSSQTIIYTLPKVIPPKTDGDKTLLFYEGYITDVNVEVDEIDISSLFGEDLQYVISHLLEENRDPWEVFDLIVYRDMKELKRPDEYDFDWESLVLKTKNPFFNYTHYVGLYGDLHEIKKILEGKSGNVSE